MTIRPGPGARPVASRAGHKLLAISLIPMMCNCAAAADTAEAFRTPAFSFAAFGTLGVVHSSESRADFTSSPFKPQGAGYTRQWSVEPDSRIAGQLTVIMTPRLSAVVQLIAEQNFDHTYKPRVEWANIKYQLTPDWSVRVGRIDLPSFLFSDSRNVGYINPWVRAPVEAYNLVPVLSSDGADMSYRVQIGRFMHTVVGTFGRSVPRLPMGGEAEARREWVIADNIEYGAATMHIAYQEAHLSVDGFDGLFDAFRQFGPQGNALADKYGTRDKRVTFIDIGGMYDPGKWFVLGEWGTTDLRSVLGASAGWYATAGYRLAKFTPYLTYAAVKADSDTSSPGLNLSLLPPSLAPLAAGLNAGLNAALSASPVQRTISLGVRWDFTHNIDLKLQFDHTRLGAGSAGALTRLQPDFVRGGTVNLFTATIDFVL
jgi:hypothetical protein